MDTIYIRTEASSTIGTGHFMRCFAIAEEARARHIKVVFVLNEALSFVQARVQSIGALWHRVDTPIGSSLDGHALLSLVPNEDWVIVDSYKASSDYLNALSKTHKLCVIDDLCDRGQINVPLVINASNAGLAMDYDKQFPLAKALIGSEFAMIRKEFQTQLPSYEGTPFIALFFGGADPRALGLECASMFIKAMPEQSFKIIVGPANQDLDPLMALQNQYPNLEVLHHPQSLTEALNGAQLVLTQAGSGIGELASLGHMALVLIAYDNQIGALQSCPYPVLDARSHLPESLVQTLRFYSENKEVCAQIRQKARAQFDGLGPKRILDVLSRDRHDKVLTSIE